MTVMMAISATIEDIQQRYVEEMNNRATPSRSSQASVRSSQASAAAAAEFARGLVISCGGRILRSSDSTLADCCLAAGAAGVVEISAPLPGGMPTCCPPWARRGPEAADAGLAAARPASGTARPELRSIARGGLDRMLRELARTAAGASEAWRRRTDGGARMSSHDLRAVFQNRAGDAAADGGGWEVFLGGAPFHPQARYPELYSEEEPDVAITYTWAMCLLTELPRFLDHIERELGLGREVRCAAAAADGPRGAR